MFRLNLVRYLLAIFILLGGVAIPASFAASKEERAFKTAATYLETRVYDLAEQSFAKFIEEHPASTNRVDAILHQAQARFYLTNYSGAFELLQKGLPEAGSLAPDYQYWIGQTFFKNHKFREAADAFSALGKNFPQSPYQLESAYKEALAESELGNLPRVIELLQTPGGKFEVAAKAQPNSGFSVDGYLLLGEALLSQAHFVEAEKVVAQLGGGNMVPEAKWRQNDLLCRVQVAAGRLENALQTTTNLLLTAKESGRGNLFAKSLLLRGEILQKLNRLPEAMQAFEQNLAEGSVTNVPVEIRRQSFFKTIELNLAQGATTNAIARLENFVQQNASDPSVDLAKLTLGELRLKQYVVAIAQGGAVASASGNFFQQAQINFTTVITNYPQSAHLGKAFLGRGWCFWLENKFGEAESDFAEATKRLPVSEDQAIARFKLADAQFRRTNYAAAVTNYQALIEAHAGVERVTNTLFESALYQTVRASLKVGNDIAATNAMQKLLTWFPNGSFGDRSLLLVGQNFTRAGKAAESRELMVDFLKRFPETPQAAEIKLAIAQTFVEEKNWAVAVTEYDRWVTNFVSHPLRRQGEFSRALVYDKAGQETNAFNAFTNFVAQFPSNHLAAIAQNWVADFYWNHEDYRNAEKSYQELFQKFPSSPELGYRARLMAGRSAYDRANYGDAAIYFGDLVTALDKDTNAPAILTGEALFALADTRYQDFVANTNNDVSQAITVFNRITKDPANPLAAPAWGRIGDCYFQWASRDPAQAEVSYKKAQDAYGLAMNSPLADVATRSEAEVCLGNVCVKQAELSSGPAKKKWLDAALRAYMNVVALGNLRDGESFDAKWVYEGGVQAAKLCENGGQWTQARNIYELLAKRLPALNAVLEKKIVVARSRLETAKD
ncbi:MAG: tetratricopeptide repeat protein [Verrucomicrobiota bacterium]